MATWTDVSGVCAALPETAEAASRDGARQWQVRGKTFLWERPLRKKDVAELGDRTPVASPLAAYVPDEGAKAALLADDPGAFFTTSHFDGYPIVLCRLDQLDRRTLTELAAEAWACRAPRRLVGEYRFDDR
jgi:hypothetical protein